MSEVRGALDSREKSIEIQEQDFVLEADWLDECRLLVRIYELS